MPRKSFPTKSFLSLVRTSILENNYFFGAFSLFVLIGGLTLCLINQGDLLLFFNDNRTPFSNFFFKNTTKLGEEFSYIFFIILFLFYRFRFVLLILLTAILVTIISFLSKSFFLHPRPSLFYKNLGTFTDLNLVDGVHVVTGFSSFPSGHTMSGFALFTLIALLTKNKKWMGLLLFVLALMVGLSRVYLVQHFFKDIYLGGIMGVLLALLIFSFQLLYPYDDNRWIDRKFG